ncbi:MAG TPA: septum formation initiator family protein [Alphaproteobacteria bacterium]|jgi:cell division protein FtsB|nr:septum formation initiator family protein [Alphaproteobacteria bacterium]
MALVKDVRTYARQVVGPTLAVSLFAYFAYHAIEGDRGILAWVKLTQEVESTQAELEKITHTREVLAHQTDLLRSDALDPDMLDERARSVLGVIRKDEILISPPTPDRSDAGTGTGTGSGQRGRVVALTLDKAR